MPVSKSYPSSSQKRPERGVPQRGQAGSSAGSAAGAGRRSVEAAPPRHLQVVGVVLVAAGVGEGESGLAA
ncbi:hypothetical protein, partial [Actinomadura sp. NPDC000929]|uniref:hypothetical protein n=1 Tax=Actinomadura sp. NPDC000929 TaxID=3154517 RepID=UPI003397B675